MPSSWIMKNQCVFLLLFFFFFSHSRIFMSFIPSLSCYSDGITVSRSFSFPSAWTLRKFWYCSMQLVLVWGVKLSSHNILFFCNNPELLLTGFEFREFYMPKVFWQYYQITTGYTVLPLTGKPEKTALVTVYLCQGGQPAREMGMKSSAPQPKGDTQLLASGGWRWLLGKMGATEISFKHFLLAGVLENVVFKVFWHKAGFNSKWVPFWGWAKAMSPSSLALRSKKFLIFNNQCRFYRIAAPWELLFLLRKQNCWGRLWQADLGDSDLFSRFSVVMSKL